MQPWLRDVLDQSFLAGLPADVVESICADAILVQRPARELVYRAGATAQVGLVVRGLLRAQVTSPDGRQAALWYVQVGDVFGVATLFGAPEPIELAAIADCTLLRFDGRALAKRARTDGRLACALAAEVARRLVRTSDELAWAAFGTVRQRVARHLLILAGPPGPGPASSPRVSQQTIADSLGTAREVVARAIGQLRADGLVETGPNGFVVRDRAGLSREAAEAVGSARPSWL